MENLNINEILNRQDIIFKISNILLYFQENCKNVNFKKGIYIYGSPGSGKTYFVTELLKELGYDVIKYDAGDVRNKSLIDTITSNNISSYNVLDMLKGKKRRIAIVMDEIDGMNSGDKGGITSLIKLIRQKKTKKQKTENATLNPIICIGNYFMDKKIRELMKVCNVFELNTPTAAQTSIIVRQLMPNVDHDLTFNPLEQGCQGKSGIMQSTIPVKGSTRSTGLLPDDNQPGESSLTNELVNYIQGDMRKIKFLYNLYLKKPELVNKNTINDILHIKSYNDDSKNIAATLFEKPVELAKHNTFMNETERTIVALLWHENIIDIITRIPRDVAVPFYLKILNNICYADYIDRITFQNQIWIFNEMTSLIKTFYNNSLFHTELGGYMCCHGDAGTIFKEDETGGILEKYKNAKKKDDDIRFTKVLTKYSTEYNNILFVYMLCQSLDMDKKDLVAFFQELRLVYGSEFYNQTDKLLSVEKMFDGLINKLDIKRMYRYLDKNVKRDAAAIEDESELDEDD